VSFRLTSRARRDIASADAWWQENRPEAHNAVLDEIAEALELLAEQPEAGVGYGVHNGMMVRRVFLRTTRRNLYYTVEDGVIEVLRVCGAERGAQPRFGKKTSLS
jgi:plasmid stabilization system protein ParE